MTPQRATTGLALAAFLLAGCEHAPPTQPAADATLRAHRVPVATTPGPQTVLASGLLYPRGLTFGKDGDVYVAEAGTPAGHTMSTVGQCEQVPPPQGPHRGGATGRISRIDARGARTTVASGLPSAADPANAVVGVTDLAFVDRHLYALVNGGCSQGHLDVPASVLRVARDGSWRVAADLSAWVHANPVANPSPRDFEPDGDWYSMIFANGRLLAVDANRGEIVSVQPQSGRVSRLADVSADVGHAVPTAIAEARGGELLVGELTTFPAKPGAASVLRYGRDGRLRGAITGFTAILGVDTDRHGNVYVLESFTCASAAPCFPSPGSGRVTRIDARGARQVVASGLSFATSARIGDDGALYISNFGYGPPNAGQIVRVANPDAGAARGGKGDDDDDDDD